MKFVETSVLKVSTYFAFVKKLLMLKMLVDYVFVSVGQEEKHLTVK